MAISVLTILGLMFTTDEEFTRREGLFGGVFFESSPTSHGTTNVSAGAENLVSLGMIFAFVAVVLFMTQTIYTALRSRQRALRGEHA